MYVICPNCKIKFDKDNIDNIRIGNRYYHLYCCSEDDIYRDKIFKYSKQLWGNYNFVKINNQITSYQKDYNLSCKDIYNSLVYFFDIEKKDPSTYPGTIGIVPYVYDKAKIYFAKLEAIEKRKELINKQLQNQLTKEEQTIIIQPSHREKTRTQFKIEE